MPGHGNCPTLLCRAMPKLSFLKGFGGGNIGANLLLHTVKTTR